jgi:3-polyprenyl-4-hydroxybenzoate decarboxylase
VKAWLRSQRAAAVDSDDRLLLVGGDGVVRAIEDDGAELARVVLAYVDVPRTLDAIVAHVEAQSGQEGVRTLVEQLVEVLRTSGAISGVDVAANDDTARSAGHGRRGNVVVGISGAVAASHAPAFIAALQRRGWTVEVALTQAAQRFVAADALAALVRRAPHVSMWPDAPHAPVPHVALAEWADLVVVYPASATTIARLAGGDFSDVVAATALATRAPVVVVPSMNAAMLEAAAVQRNLDKLRADGFAIVHGVPSLEAADAPAVRTASGGAAPAPGETAATIDALASTGVLTGRDRGAGVRAWDEMYRRPHVPWASEACDPDLAGALVHHAPPPARLLDIGCGLGQVAKHAAGLGYRVVATDVSDVALARARDGSDVVWLRDDICASALAGPFDVIVDRAVLHALPAPRVAAWAAAIDRLAAAHATVIVKVHADKAPRIEQLDGFHVVEQADAELPGIADATPVPSRLIVLQR